ncbi:MAG TPA: hypothetical protein VMV72_04410 [Verrucomicrobiae bacterium]|nr:hypothetical protein [Verrucomicrobiae bacterium]
MNKTLVAVVGILCLSGLVGLYIWTSHNRFYITRSTEDLAYEVDRKTGQSWMLEGEVKKLMTGNVEAAPPEPTEQELPTDEALKINGTAHIDDLGYLTGSFYNGSTWKVSRVVVTLSQGDGVDSSTRDYSEDIDIYPLTTRDFSIEIIGQKSLKSWRVKQAFGRKS